MPTAATVLGQGETDSQAPFFLPDGRHFLYRAITGPAGGPIYLASLDSAERKLLLNADSANVLYTQGHLLFLRETTLMAQPFDARRLVLTGEAFPIAEQIQTSKRHCPPYGVFSASENGVLAYQTGTAAAAPNSCGLTAPASRSAYLEIRLHTATLSFLQTVSGLPSAFQISRGRGGTSGFTTWRAASGRVLRSTRQTQLTSIWSPDGSRVVFNSRRKGHLDLYQKASSGAGTEEVLLEDNLDKYPLSWSPDGRFILYSSTGGPTGDDLFVLPLSGDRKPVPFLKTQFNEYCRSILSRRPVGRVRFRRVWQN